MWFDFENPGSLHHIDVTLPAGGLSSFTIYEDAGYWEYGSPTSYSSLSALLGLGVLSLLRRKRRAKSNQRL